MGRNPVASGHGYFGRNAHAGRPVGFAAAARAPQDGRWARRILSRRSALSAVLLAAGLLIAGRPASAALTAERLALHQFEDGPVLAASHPFLPGETAYFSCRLQGFQVATGPDEKRTVRLSWKVAVADPAGVPVAPPKEGRIEEQVFQQDKNWLPKFLYSFSIPAFAPGGRYAILVQAKDEVGKTELNTRLEFDVRGHDVEPSATLAGRNLRFLRSEQDGPPLEPAVYHPGEMLWARFDITGYKYGEKNHYDVEYGLAILKESGEQVFAQPAAASDSHESFYPQRYVPGSVSLNLDPNVPVGAYTLVVTLEDKVGGQKAETRGAFRIER